MYFANFSLRYFTSLQDSENDLRQRTRGMFLFLHRDSPLGQCIFFTAIHIENTNKQSTNAKQFISEKVIPAFEDFKSVLEEHEREVTIEK